MGDTFSRPSKPVLILMGRWPIAGYCKKRLAADIGPNKAANIQAKLTEHTITVAKELHQEGLVEIQLAINGLPINNKQSQAFLGIRNIKYQGKGNLGEKMMEQIVYAQRNKCNNNSTRKTIIIGTDLPNLCRRDIIEAIYNLEKSELVLGPAKDGGYWLIGFSEKLLNPLVTWPFTNIPWGTNEVLKKTIKHAKIARVSHILIHEKNDLDQITDLAPWQAEPTLPVLA